MRAPSSVLNRNQLIAFILALMTVISSLFALEYFRQRENLLDELSEQLDIISGNSIASLLFMDKVAAKQVLGTLSSSLIIDSAAIYDQSGNLFVAFAHGKTPLNKIDTTKLALKTTRETLSASEIWIPMVAEDNVVGYIYGHSSLKLLYRQLLWYLFATTGVIVAIAVAASWAFKRMQKAVQQAEARVDFMQSNDAVTQLPNRHAFNERLHELLNHQNDKSIALLLLDLDNFRLINDGFGQHIGDVLLHMVTRRLQGVLSNRYTLFRVGGDEFAVILHDAEGLERKDIYSNLLLQAMANPFLLETHTIYTSITIGISCAPNDGSDVVTLFKAAEAAMYHAKKRGKNQYQLFSSEMNEKSKTRLSIESELHTAIANKEFELHYQPQIDLNTGLIIGAEALIRWRHPEKGLVSPMSFISIAEETGLIVPIGEWVIRTACSQLNTWQKNGLSPVRISVNLSARQFHELSLVDKIANILLESDINPEYLEMEITESILMDDLEDAIKRLQAIRLMGIHLAIDDFGTGYSSLSYLKRFPVERIKIDRSFIQDIPQDADDAAIALATIQMAKGLKLEVVAEGVETQAQVEFLREYQCQIAQGFYFSKPLEASRMTELLKNRKCPMTAASEFL